MALKYRDYYEVLEVPRTATDAEIKKAFRKLARQYHPDVAKTKKGAEDKFKEINEAYEVLGDATKRQRYDQLGPNWKSGADFRPPSGNHQEFRGGKPYSGGNNTGDFEFEFGGSTGFSDFFEQVFGSRARTSGANPGANPFANPRFEPADVAERGRDVQGEIMATLEEVSNGSVRSISVNRKVACQECRGTGEKAGKTCATCGGSGQITQKQIFKVKIPVGVTEGQLLRIPGAGDPGLHGGSPGDIFLRVHLAKHPDFEVEDHDLIYEAELAPWEAVLGAKLSIPTLGGEVSIKIPPCTQIGQKLRVRGRGLPTRSGPPGDLIVVSNIQMPETVTEKERQVWTQLAQVSDKPDFTEK